MFRWKWLLLVIIILFTIYVAITFYSSSDDKHVDCPIKPFGEFAYLPPHEEAFPIPPALPGPPWQIETNISEGFHFGPVLARTKNGQQEIWLLSPPRYGSQRALLKEGSFLIYRPASQTWEEVSAVLGDTNLIVRDLFITSDDALWGLIWMWQDDPIPANAPVLGKFNESSRRFEAAAGGLEIPIMVSGGVIDGPEIVLDAQDIFWIFVPRDGIYRYDPQTSVIDRQIDLPNPDIYLMEAVLSLDGSIYFNVIYPYQPHDFLFQFIPDTGKITSLDVPNETWENFSGLLVDHKGRLWLGAMGYLETNGRWRLIHPHPRKNFRYFGYPLWFPPHLVFESSNGLLWYTKDLDMGLTGQGTAWYDPETGQGCQFTNLASFIVEDDSKQLWMVANGKLYRYALEE